MVKSTRKLNFRADVFHPYSVALGELSLAWNDLHEMLGGLFWAATGIPNGVIPLSIWYSSKSDRAQRDMLRSLAESPALGNILTEDAKKEVSWILKRADALEEIRNNALHSPLFQSGDDPVVPHHELGHRRAKHLANKDMLKEFRWFYDTATILRDYALDLQAAIQLPSISWPDRPDLPNRGDTNES